MHVRTFLRTLEYLSILLLSITPCLAIVPVRMVKETRILVKADILALGSEGTERLATMSAEIPAGKKGFLAKTVALKNSIGQEEISIQVEIQADEKNKEKIILDMSSKVAQVGAPKNVEFKRKERIELNEDSSSLLEIYKSPVTDKKLILNLSGNIKEVETFKPISPSTTRVLFQLNISRIAGGKEILLERNSLSTFLGQTASYYLHLHTGEKDKTTEKSGEDELDIRMIPLSIADEIAEVEIAVAGKIIKSGGGESNVDFRRIEKISNSSSHEVIIASEEADGKALEGYKFEIVPSF